MTTGTEPTLTTDAITDLCEDCNERPITGLDARCDTCRQNADESAYERSLSECFRGGEYAAYVAADMGGSEEVEMTDAYTAFKETDACARCHEGESWTVKGPDGVCIGQSWEGDDAECNAEETAQMLNAAFEAGKQAAAAEETAARKERLGERWS